MDIKQILLVLDTGSGGERAAGVAASIAAREGAMVEGVCLFHEPETAVADSFAVGAAGVSDVLARREASIGALAAPAEAMFHKSVTAHGMSAGWSIAEIDGAAQSMVARALQADLVVVAAPAEDHVLRRIAERLALGSGAPCLLVPRGAASDTSFRRVVLAWNGSREAKRALADAMPFLKQAAAVAVVIAGEETTRWIDDAAAQGLIRLLDRHGVSAALLRAAGDRAQAGNVLLDQCDAFGADLLVMGAYGHSRAAETILGGATRTILSDARLPVLLSH